MSVFRDHQLLAITMIAMLACQGMEKATAQQSINYDDGQEHVLTDAVQRVVVSNGSLLDIRANVEHVEVNAAVLLHNGGQVGSMSPEKGITLRNGANATLRSGRVWGIEIDAATLTLDGGFVNYFDCNTIEVHNHSNFILESGGVGAADPGCRGLDVLDSNVMVNGGSTGGITWLAGASTANIASGTLTNIDNGTLYASDTSSITITGGLVTTPHDVVIRLDDSATLRLTGGEVDAFHGNGIFANHQSIVDIWGGVVRSNENSVVSVGGSSQLRIAGGTFELGEDIYPHINAAGESNVTIFGRDFNFPVSKPIEPLGGVITGTLADGSHVNWRYNRETTATITLLAFVPGDFTLDGVLNSDDIDAQAVAMRSSSAETTIYDQNDDGRIDASDREIWIHEYAATWFGDANLDGEFNSGDLVQVFQMAAYENSVPAGWKEGDWNGDGVFDSGDLVWAFQDGGYKRGPRPNIATVPEPSSLLLVIGALGVLLARHR